MKRYLFRPDALIGLSCGVFLVLATEYAWLGRYGPSGQVEVGAVVLYAWAVWLAVKNSVWNWVVSVVATGLYLYVFLDLRFYADAGLQVVFIVFSLVGLWEWMRREEDEEATEAERATGTEIAVLGAAGDRDGVHHPRVSDRDQRSRSILGRDADGRIPGRPVSAHSKADRDLVPVGRRRRRLHRCVHQPRPVPVGRFVRRAAGDGRPRLLRVAAVAGGPDGRGDVSLGLIIGKFLPFHRGHAEILVAAESRCDEVAVVICDAGWHGIPFERRIEWVRRASPAARVLVLDGDELGLGDDDSAGWARATRAVLGRAPDVVFSSEDYGPRYAELMGSEHVMVDRQRLRVPVSGTALREDLFANLGFLEAHVRADLVPRIAVLGAESTGKTTLCADLAAHYGVPFVPEFGRFYTEAMPDARRYRWNPRDFELIAAAQGRFEEDAATWVDGPLICDTNPFMTAVFAEAYLGEPMTALEEEAGARDYDLHLLTDPSTPFEQDGTGLRADGERRAWMHERYRRHLDSRKSPTLELSGDRTERLRVALVEIDAIAQRWSLSGSPQTLP